MLGVPTRDVSKHFPLETWVYFMICRSGTTVTLHCNGQLCETWLNTTASVLNANNDPMYIGASKNSGFSERFRPWLLLSHVTKKSHQFAQGHLADIRLYRGTVLNGTVVPNAPW